MGRAGNPFGGRTGGPGGSGNSVVRIKVTETLVLER
jgi:hypothetical protein